ncbi:DHA2 family efflux MFS transporter permease subunit [Leeia sp. TBRC 13508]|uniref:DHA2 family efflux MFS transporter permease subunit n=1 Tax=Leeia speluncae TaxID=2884804 RepID=A0ABS8D3S2_9NEIS|nr:DHA2 family efflux MFS transporter permease subunit [Leeia speluncae]MCB6182842.1 DHA2 family efflux MFS transporter permease subunit [Leeia speluncae]
MSAAQTAQPAPQRLHGLPLALMTLAVALGTFMEVLDTTITNVAIPHIAGNLAVSSTQGTWVISSYGLASAMAVPLTGWLAQRFGQVKMFVISVLLFTITSMLCGLATSLPMLVVFRFMQGLVSGPMVPLSQTLLLSNYPPEKKGVALALWSMTVIVAPIFGPLLGGWLTDNFAWPWIFFINVPVGIFSGIVAWGLLKKHETPTAKKPIDVVGLALLFIGVGSLQLMLDNGSDNDWFESSFILALAVIAVIALCFFVVWELTDKHPVVDLTLFKSHNFRYGVLALSLGMFCFFGSTVLFPLYLQTVMGYTSTWAGLATAPVGLLAFVLSPIIGKNIARLNLRLVATFAFIVFSATMLWVASFNLETDFNHMFLPRLLQGIGIACFFIPINTIVMSGLPPERMASAAGLSNFFRTLSGSFATAIAVTLWDHRSTFHHATLTEHITAGSLETNRFLDTLQSVGMPLQGAYKQIDQMISQQALMMATIDVFHSFGILFLVLIGVIWLTKPIKGFGGGGGGGH